MRRDMIAPIPRERMATMSSSTPIRVLSVRSDRNAHPGLAKLVRNCRRKPLLNEVNVRHLIRRRQLRGADRLTRLSGYEDPWISYHAPKSNKPHTSLSRVSELLSQPACPLCLVKTSGKSTVTVLCCPSKACSIDTYHDCHVAIIWWLP